MQVKKLILISSRSLGDAVMHAQFLKNIKENNPNIKIYVWTFPAAKAIFDNFLNCNIFISNFPMGATSKKFTRNINIDFLSNLIKIRKEQIDLAIDLVGDFREVFVVKSMGVKKVIFPIWEKNHQFLKQIRTIKLNSYGGVFIPKEIVNIYDSLDYIGLKLKENLDLAYVSKSVRGAYKLKKFGIHPFASVDYKMWERNKWISVANLIKNKFKNAEITFFGTNDDLPYLNEIRNSLNFQVEVVISDIAGFSKSLSLLDFFIGLDSLGVHLASANGLNGLVLVGGNPPELFIPKKFEYVRTTGFCAFQPCSGRTSCFGDNRYICMKSIEPIDVVNKIN